MRRLPVDPLTPTAHNVFATWEKDFTLGHREQRGAGMTWGHNRPAEDEALTMERLARRRCSAPTSAPCR
jgi:hypothetical protein